jgi:hypothetical protein
LSLISLGAFIITFGAEKVTLTTNIFRLLIATLILLPLQHEVCGQNSNNTESMLETLEELYERGLFQQVLSGLESDALRSRIRTMEEQAHRLALLARTYLALDKRELAQQAVDSLLGLDPDYIPGYPQDHDFQEMVITTKKEIAKKEARQRRIKLIASGTVAAGILTYILWPPPPVKPLPMPPGPPESTY